MMCTDDGLQLSKWLFIGLVNKSVDGLRALLYTPNGNRGRDGSRNRPIIGVKSIAPCVKTLATMFYPKNLHILSVTK